jgi:curved DNA-binding protein CbpA
MDPYKELGLPRSASTDEIRKRFKSLAQIFHPDKGGTEEKFKIVKESYEILIDESRRRSYDRFGDIEPKSDARSESVTELNNLLSQIVSDADPDRDNLISLLADRIKAIRSTIMAKIESDKKLTEKFDKIIKRINHTSSEEDLIRNFIRYKIQITHKEIDENFNFLQVLDAMEDILKEYTYVIDVTAIELDKNNNLVLKTS